MGAQFFRREAEGHFLLEGIGVDGDGAGGDEIFPAVEKERHGFALHAEGLNRQVDFEFAAAKGELRRAELGDAHVGKAFGFADADGENRHGEWRHAIERFHFAVGDAVAENDDAGARGTVARGALQQLDQTRARILGAQPLQTARRDRL